MYDCVDGLIQSTCWCNNYQTIKISTVAVVRDSDSEVELPERFHSEAVIKQGSPAGLLQCTHSVTSRATPAEQYRAGRFV